MPAKLFGAFPVRRQFPFGGIHPCALVAVLGQYHVGTGIKGRQPFTQMQACGKPAHQYPVIIMLRSPPGRRAPGRKVDPPVAVVLFCRAAHERGRNLVVSQVTVALNPPKFGPPFINVMNGKTHPRLDGDVLFFEIYFVTIFHQRIVGSLLVIVGGKTTRLVRQKGIPHPCECLFL